MLIFNILFDKVDRAPGHEKKEEKDFLQII